MLVNFGKAVLIRKILQQPDKFYEVLDKACTDGLLLLSMQFSACLIAASSWLLQCWKSGSR